MNWDAFYRIARKGEEFYVVDEDGEPLDDEPLSSVSISHLPTWDCDHIGGYNIEGSGKTILSKNAERELTSEQKKLIKFIVTD